MKIIISLTSYGKRLETLPLCLTSIFNQTYKADKVILNISGKDSLPQSILKFQDKGLSIFHVPVDLKPHNKYYYTMKRYPEDIIITLDDDIIYPSDLIEKLLLSYKRFPNSVSAGRAHKMLFDGNGNLMPYLKWERECNLYDCPSMDLFATGVGGVLYPPHSMNIELFNQTQIQRLCLYADDLWLKFMQLMQNTPVVLIKQERQHPPGIPGVYDNGLFLENKYNNRNDVYIQKIIKAYNIRKR